MSSASWCLFCGRYSRTKLMTSSATLGGASVDAKRTDCRYWRGLSLLQAALMTHSSTNTKYFYSGATRATAKCKYGRCAVCCVACACIQSGSHCSRAACFGWPGASSARCTTPQKEGHPELSGCALALCMYRPPVRQQLSHLVAHWQRPRHQAFGRAQHCHRGIAHMAGDAWHSNIVTDPDVAVQVTSPASIPIPNYAPALVRLTFLGITDSWQR